MNGLVLDIEGGGRNPRTKVVTWHKKDSANDNQLWYDDFATGTIRSKLHDLCLDIEGLFNIVSELHTSHDRIRGFNRINPFLSDTNSMKIFLVYLDRILESNCILSFGDGDENTTSISL